MPTQTITVNGHAYLLSPLDNSVNCDYVLQLPSLHPNASFGTLRWDGNGETRFDYQGYDVYGETIGTYPNLTAAVTQFDSIIFPNSLSAERTARSSRP